MSDPKWVHFAPQSCSPQQKVLFYAKPESSPSALHPVSHLLMGCTGGDFSVPPSGAVKGGSPMMKYILFLALILSGTQLEAQRLVDHWATVEECLAAVDAPFYYPSTRSNKKLGPNEVVRGVPHASCIEMDLPDRMGGRGYVKIEAGREGTYNSQTGKMMTLYACRNEVYKVVPIPLPRGHDGKPGPKGDKGDVGPQGLPGQVVYAPPAPTALAPDFGGRYEVRRDRFPWGKVAIGTAIVGTVAYFLGTRSKKEPKGKPPGGTIGPAFHFSF